MSLFEGKLFADERFKNPMCVKHGVSDEERYCYECKHVCKVMGNSRSYTKCRRRGISSSVGTDHVLRWHACSLFEEK